MNYPGRKRPLVTGKAEGVQGYEASGVGYTVVARSLSGMGGDGMVGRMEILGRKEKCGSGAGRRTNVAAWKGVEGSNETG